MNKAVDVFEIRFDNNDQAVYSEGDHVAGTVRLELQDEIKLKGIKLEICGIAMVRWDGEANLDCDPDERLKGDCNREVYFQKHISLFEKDGGFLEKDPVLPDGEYVYPFECKLPPELPSSFEGQYGQIRYLAKATIERPWKMNVVTKRAFTVLSGLDLNFIPEAATKIELCKYKDVGGLCCSSGSITIDWTVDRSGYVPGEDIVINGAVQNESNETVSVSKAVLYMVVDYKSKKRQRREKRQLMIVDKGETPPGDVTVWNESLHIPPVPPTGLGRCQLVDVSYELQFLASFQGKLAPVSFTKDIYIGTVPVCHKEMKSCIAGMYNQPYYESSELLGEGSLGKARSTVSLTQIIAAASITESQTPATAPSLGTLERSCDFPPMSVYPELNLGTDQTPGGARTPGGDRPPPFAPTHMYDQPEAPADVVTTAPSAVVTAAPSAPSAFTLGRPWQEGQDPNTGLYPTLAASWFGPVNIRDKEDNDATQGDLSFQPVYPYFNTLGRPNHPL